MSTLDDLRAELLEVTAAISVVMTGQSYKIGQRLLTRADLAALTAREKWLREEIRREERGRKVKVLRGVAYR